MKILFLDVDGVMNNRDTLTRSARNKGIIGIDAYLSYLVRRISNSTGCKVVLSSSWRYHPEGVQEVEMMLGFPLHDKTGTRNETGGIEKCIRGNEIKEWLDAHPEVTQYAILDDENDMLPEQQKYFYKTSFEEGITADISEKIIRYFNNKQSR